MEFKEVEDIKNWCLAK